MNVLKMSLYTFLFKKIALNFSRTVSNGFTPTKEDFFMAVPTSVIKGD